MKNTRIRQDSKPVPISTEQLLLLAQNWRACATRLELNYSGDVMMASKAALESCAEELEGLCKGADSTTILVINPTNQTK